MTIIDVIAMTSTDSAESTALSSRRAEGVLVTSDAKGRLRVPKEQREAVLARFEQSGMSAAKFAGVAGIKYSTFAGWVQVQPIAWPIPPRDSRLITHESPAKRVRGPGTGGCTRADEKRVYLVCAGWNSR